MFFADVKHRFGQTGFHWNRLQHYLMFLLSVSVASGFNFDLLSPTIVGSGVTNGEAISFGFSLAQHALSNGTMTTLVGAPKADSDRYQREGGVFRCPFINGGTCQFETLFQSREDANPELFKFPLSTRNLSNMDQLLGFSLRSLASGRVVACAPLYVPILTRTIVQSVEYLSGTPRGRCVIILNQDLLPADSSGSTQVLQLSSSDITGDRLSLAGVDTGSLNVSEVEYLALGSAMSGASPIPAGQVYLTELSPGGIGRDDTTLSSPSLNAPAVPLTGYHIETGYFTTNTGTQQIATSAPRGENHMGQIQIMSVGVQLNPVSTVSGDEVDGYFGYDFAILDINSQGYHSLVVGCPLCARERGRIYVLSHTGVPSDPFTKSSIESPSSMRGRFGLAVENIGDIDKDGYTDIAVSAPYAAGEGVVYIFRGAGDHLVTKDYQEIPAVPNSKAFGYSLSGGLDIDGNGYADVSIGDLSGSHVTTFRSSPLVTVTVEFQDLKTLLDIGGNVDRRCPLILGGSVNLLCFNVTPCVYYESSEVNEFAISYSVIVDQLKKRVGLYKPPVANNIPAELTTNEISGNVMMRGTGRDNRVCSQTYTFALSADFTETAPIPVDLSISDVPQPLSLTSDPEMELLGGPLHPVLRRYVAGDQPLPLSIVKEVSFNLNCSGGSDPDLCEPNYEINLVKDFDETTPLASTNEFGFRVGITNTARDDGLNPMLLIALPQGVLLSRYVSVSPNALTSCNIRAADDQKTTVECSLSNPTLAGSTLQLEIYFLLNDSAIPLSKKQLALQFSVLDGVNQSLVTTATQNIGLDAVAGFKLTSSVAEESYQAYRSIHFIQNISTILLNETGPLINLRTSVENSRHTSNGTTIPQSIVKIHLPVEVVDRGGRRSRPLIIPTEVLTGLGNVNCSHYNAIPSGLPLAQQPTSFLPAWTGSPIQQNPSCQKDGRYRCGVVICTITDLKPAPAPATQLTLFARLYSSSVVNGEVTIVSEVEVSGADSPRIEQDPDSSNTSQVTFQVSQAITDVPRECIQYWVVVVPVVIGIFLLTVIIAILGCCGIFRRRRNMKELELTEETDNGFQYHHRAIPPIPGLDQNGGRGTGIMKEEESVGGASDKEKEAEAEAEMELEIMTRADVGDDEPDIPPQSDLPAPPPSDEQPLRDYDFDPSLGVDGGEGEETDL